MEKIYIFLFMLSIGIISGPVIAEVYKWVDEHGQTHYGEKAPVTNAQQIQIEEVTADKSMEKYNQEREKLLRIYEEERNTKKDEDLKAEKLKAEKEQKCQNLKTEIANLQRGGRVYYNVDDSGERIFLSEEEVSARIKNMQNDYDKYCK